MKGDAFFHVPLSEARTSEGMVDLPMFFYNVGVRHLNYWVDYERVVPKLEGTGLVPLRFFDGKGVDVTNVYPWWVKTDLLRSPEYGQARIDRLPLPGILVDKPERVVREIINGIRKGRLHVYPGIYAKLAYQASRWTPLISRQAH